MASVILLGLLEDDENQSVAREIQAFQRLSEISSTFRFLLRDEETFTSELLQYEGRPLAPGVLTVAALGWDPPERSTHFHVSLLSASGDIVSTPEGPSIEEAKVLAVELPKLNTKSMTFLPGEGLDYALVWERRVDLMTNQPASLIEKGLKASLPEGDLENTLRRLIDDSTNLLSEQEFNLRRLDQGQKPINIAWPWGHGERQTVENLALRLGYPLRVYANSWEVRGLARLSGLKVERTAALRKMNGSQLASLIRTLKKEPHSLVIFSFDGFEGEELKEEKLHAVHEFGKFFLQPLLDWHVETKQPVVVLASNQKGEGIVAVAQEKPSERDHFPFDERSVVERKVPEIALSQVLDAKV
jgi:2,3-bisphosphoglycerate-independent phosphoglycerate mutase